jgi:hypothetical protein
VSHWNYRILKRKHKGTLSNGEPYEEEQFGIVEAYYGDEGEDGRVGWTADFMEPSGETREELLSDMIMMMEAFTKPVLDEEELEREYAGKPSWVDQMLTEAGETKPLQQMIAELEAGYTGTRVGDGEPWDKFGPEGAP